MNWISKKIIVNKLKSFFHIEDENNIEVSLLGKHQIKLQNILLKTSVVNSDDMLIHIQYCKIKTIQIQFDSSQMSNGPLLLKVDRVQLVVKFNPNKTPKFSKHTQPRKQIDQFNEAVASQKPYQQKSFFEQEINNLKKIFGDFCIGKLNLVVTNIDVSLQYKINGQYRYVGVEIGEIEVKQRVVVSNTLEQQNHNEQLHASLCGVGAYLGVAGQQNLILRQTQRRQILHKRIDIKKKYILEKQVVNAFYNINNSFISVIVQTIEINCTKLCLREIFNIVNYVVPFFSDRPSLRPGQGQVKELQFKERLVNLTKGTLSWWKYLNAELIQKIQVTSKKNLMTNQKFKQYLYYLMYRYTFGYHQHFQSLIRAYESFQSSVCIFRYHLFILQKIYNIQTSKQQHIQSKGFVNYLTRIQKNKQKFKGIKFKQINYNAIRYSEIFINYPNAKQFLRVFQKEEQKTFSIGVRIKQIQLNVIEHSGYRDLFNDMYMFTFQDFNKNKQLLADTYFQQQMTIPFHDKKGTKDFSIVVSGLTIQKNQTYQISVNLQSAQIFDDISVQKIFVVRGINVLSEKNNIMKQIVIANLLSFKINFIYLMVDKQFCERIVFLLSLIQIKPKNQGDQPQQDILDQFISNKVPKHRIFQTYSRTTAKIVIREAIVVTPVFSGNNLFSLQLNQIKAEAPMDQPAKLTLQHISVSRTTMQAILNRQQKQGLGIWRQNFDEWKLLENNRPLSAVIQKQRGRTVFNLILPFLLVQVACQDLYFVFNILNEWKNFIANNYLFADLNQKKNNHHRSNIPENIRKANIDFIIDMKKKFPKQWAQTIRMEGIQMILYGDSKIGSDNQILSVLLDQMALTNKNTYTNQQVTFTIKDLFVKNCLGNGSIDIYGLRQAMKGVRDSNRPVVVRNRNMQKTITLLFYSDNRHAGGNEENFLRVVHTHQINFNKSRMSRDVQIKIQPLYIFHQPQFFSSMMTIANTAINLADQNFMNTTGKIQVSRINRTANRAYQYKIYEKQVIYAKEFNQITKMNLVIDSLHFLILDKASTQFCLSLKNISIDHKTEYYVSKFFIAIKSLHLIDTSVTTGPYPVIFQALTRTQATFTTYNSSILRQRYEKSSLLSMKIKQPKIYFLLRKIMDVKNFLMQTIDSAMSVVNDSKSNQEALNSHGKQYGFCFNVQILNPQIIIPRNSLSEQYFRATIKGLTVRNYKSSLNNQKDPNDFQQSILQQEFDQNTENMSFKYDSCSQIDGSQQQFKSFMQQQSPFARKQTPSMAIFIYLKKLKLFRSFNDKVPILKTEDMNMDFQGSTFNIKIPNPIFISLTNEDYRLLIRITQQNLSEKPTIFPNKVQNTDIKQISLSNYFSISNIEWEVCLPNQNKVYLMIQRLDGSFIMFKNGQALSELTIAELELETINFNKIVKQNTTKFPMGFSQNRPTQMNQFQKLNKLHKQNRKFQTQFFDNDEQDSGISSVMRSHEGQLSQKQQFDQQKSTNIGKLCQWIKGICGKCLGCCNCFNTSKNENLKIGKIVQNIIQMVDKKKPAQMKKQAETKRQDILKPNIKAEHIKNHLQMIDFVGSLNQGIINKRKREPNLIYLYFFIQKNGQKNMYLNAKQLGISLEKDKLLFKIIQYFNFPYTVQDKPIYFVKGKFNNYRPFMMIIQLSDSYVQIASHDQKNSQERLLVKLDCIFDSRSRGDCKYGPGKNTTNIDLVFQMWFESENMPSMIKLSQPLKISQQKKTNFPYNDKSDNGKRKAVISCEQKNILYPANFSSQNCCKIYMPVFIIQSLQNIINKNFGSQQQQQSKQLRKQDEEPKDRKPLFAIKQSQLEQNQEMMKSSLRLQTPRLKRNNNSVRQAKIQAQFQDRSTNRCGFISQLKIQIQVKSKTCFMLAKLTNLEFTGLNMVSKISQVTLNKVSSKLAFQYLNQKLTQFQPFIQPWSFELHSKATKKSDLQYSKLKLISIDQVSDRLGSDTYHNGLNINLTTEFFHTYKQLQMKYFQKEFDQKENCHNLTLKNTKSYYLLFKSPSKPNYLLKNHQIAKQALQIFNQGTLKDYPQLLKKFFGRQFIVKQGSIKKMKKNQGQSKFNANNMQIYLYHSYFDHLRRRKIVTYRTPYRLLNLSKYNFKIESYAPKKKQSWYHNLGKKQYYAIPKDYYENDYLVSFSIGKYQLNQDKQYEPIREFPQLSLTQILTGKQSAQNKQLKQGKDKQFFSIQYLFQDFGVKNEFKTISAKNSKLYPILFPFSNSSRLIDQSDLTIKVGQLCFTLLCFKSEYRQYRHWIKKDGESLFYDTFLVITAPIVIFNRTPVDLNIVINGKYRMKVQAQKKVQIYTYPGDAEVYDCKIQFQQNILHTQFFFLQKGIGQYVEYMQIDKMQSVSLICSKQTETTCVVQIVADLIIQNQTNEQLELTYTKKLFPVDSLSTSCLSQVPLKSEMKISIFNEKSQGAAFSFSSVLNFLNLKKQITQPKFQPNTKIKKNQVYQKQEDGCCQCISRKVPAKIQQTIQLIALTQEKRLVSFSSTNATKQIKLKYHFIVKNLTTYPITLYQYDESFEIMTLKSQQNHYVFYYDFLAKYFMLGINKSESSLVSCAFNLDQLPGKSFTLKIKRIKPLQDAQYYEKFYYLKLDVKQIEYSNILAISQVDAPYDDFPIFIQNDTDYSLKITQNDESFFIKPKARVPFSWSNLIETSHQVEVEVEGTSKKYSLNQKSQFQPIILYESQNHIQKQKAQHKPKVLYKSEQCYISYNNILGTHLVILDLFENKLKIHKKGDEKDDEQIEIEMNKAIKMVVSASKIDIYTPGMGIFQMEPSPATFDIWCEMFRYSLSYNIKDKVFFTIQSFKNSRIFLFHNFKNGDLEDYKTVTQQYVIPTLHVSIINSAPQQIILLTAQGSKYSQITRSHSAHKNKSSMGIQTTERTLKIKKIKINNQLAYAVNPVMLSQIKKSNYPFLELKSSRQQIITENGVSDKDIIHYKSIIFFIDQAQMMVQYDLINEVLKLQKQIDYLKNQYAVNGPNQNQLMDRQSQDSQIQIQDIHKTQRFMKEQKEKQQKQKSAQNPQVYINYLEIKPIKMTISISLDRNKEEQVQTDLISILRFIPFGIDNAIIKIESFVSYHIFYDQKQLIQTLTDYYDWQLRKQMVLNAGSYDILAPIQLVKGLGMGVKNIFYDPFYEFVKKKQIKAVSQTLIEGLLTLIIFLISFFVKIINILFKFFALFTFDQQFQTGREMFRKQIFKSPMDGVIHGWRYSWRIIKSFFSDFYDLPVKYYEKYSYIGGFLGLLFAIIGIIPWIVKIIVTTYDWIYVIGVGFLNWGHYQESAMIFRSRPIRTFRKGLLLPYKYLIAQAHQILRKNQLQQIESQQIYFVKSLKKTNQRENFLILSNYRIIHNHEKKISDHDQIKLYHIKKVSIGISNEKIMMLITLSIPQRHKFFIIGYNITDYLIKFREIQTASLFLKELVHLKEQQDLKLVVEKNKQFDQKEKLEGQFWNTSFYKKSSSSQRIKMSNENLEKAIQT